MIENDFMKHVQIVPQHHDLIWGIKPKEAFFLTIFIGVPTYMLWFYPIIKTFSITTSKYKTNHKTYKKSFNKHTFYNWKILD